jgi:hypothetical protein
VWCSALTFILVVWSIYRYSHLYIIGPQRLLMQNLIRVTYAPADKKMHHRDNLIRIIDIFIDEGLLFISFEIHFVLQWRIQRNLSFFAFVKINFIDLAPQPFVAYNVVC